VLKSDGLDLFRSGPPSALVLDSSDDFLFAAVCYKDELFAGGSNYLKHFTFNANEGLGTWVESDNIKSKLTADVEPYDLIVQPTNVCGFPLLYVPSGGHDDNFLLRADRPSEVVAQFSVHSGGYTASAAIDSEHCYISTSNCDQKMYNLTRQELLDLPAPRPVGECLLMQAHEPKHWLLRAWSSTVEVVDTRTWESAWRRDIHGGLLWNATLDVPEHSVVVSGSNDAVYVRLLECNVVFV